ncbi:hypothetical protein DK095_480005 [Flavobacterium psychrophilum]|nr:hypothetical protein DK095_480005 [Flavobacterium psychrophilum]
MLGIVIDVKLEQSAKAFSPIDLTKFPTLTDVKP